MKDTPLDTLPLGGHALESARSVGAATADLLHGLKNPVAAFRTSLDLLASAHIDAADRTVLVRVMKNEVAKLSLMLERCGALTKLNDLAFAPCRLDEIVRERVEYHGAVASERGASLLATVDPAARVALDGDSLQLATAIDALLTNALDASSSGGRIEVTLTATDAHHTTLEVCDDGVGIEPAVLPNVFRVLYSTRPGAAGMGLPIARQIFLAHGGRLSLRNGAEKGAVASVVLPVR